MRVSEKQLLMLMDILKDSLKFSNVMGGYDLATRLQLINDLMNQQSNEPKEVDLTEKPRRNGKKVLNG